MSKLPIPPQKKRLESVSELLRELRFNYGFTQLQLGQQLNKSRNSISRSENSKNMTLKSLFEFIDGYDISLNEFFSGMD
jgi:transcriptional regulator with XRE-family HTH domain